MSILYIFLLDNLNNSIEEINIEKPKTYTDLIFFIKKEIKNLPDNYIIFYLSTNNKEVVEIHNNEEYQFSKDILFIREIDKMNLEKSFFQLNYDTLTDTIQDLLDDKYNCSICQTPFTNKPYFCYSCQKIYHYKCLEDWDTKKHELSENLDCPNCRNELPLDKWKEKLDYFENIENEKKYIYTINQYQKNFNLINSLILAKDKQINQLKDETIKQNKIIEKSKGYLEKISLLFKKLLDKINNIMILIDDKNTISNKAINITEKISSNPIEPPLDEITNVILEEIGNIEKYIKIKEENKISGKKVNKYNSLEDININKDKDEIVMNNKKDLRNQILIVYKINNNETKLKLFGYNFIKNNREKCQIIIQNKIHELNEYLDVSDYGNKNTLDIGLKGINDITDASYMFYNCTSLLRLSDISSWNTSKITNMSFMFSGCTSLNFLPDLSKFDTNNLIDINHMFSDCSSLISLPDISLWNTDNITNISYLFYNCSALKELPDISKWNISKVTDMSYMFSGCSLLSNLPDISVWNTSQVITMNNIFENCNKLSSLPDIEKWDIHNIFDMENMFLNCNENLIIPQKFKKNKLKRKRTIRIKY